MSEPITPAPNANPQPVQDDDGYVSDDSGYGSSANISLLTRSVHSSIYEYRYEHGRRYHAYKSGENDYFTPNDDPEQFRLDMQHRCMFLASGSKLFHAPMDHPIRVLDLGTGTGIWALEMAEAHPQAEIVGIDLSPIQPSWVPPNVKFEIDDCEDEWTFPQNHFDLIYSKTMLVGGITDWRKYFGQAFQHCAPGGYFECLEMRSEICSDHHAIQPDNPIRVWTTHLNQGIALTGKTLNVSFDVMADLMREVGFEDVEIFPFKMPIGTWPADPTLKQAGSIQLVAMLEGIEGLSLQVYTRLLGWTLASTNELIARTKTEFKAKRRCYYWPGAVVYGRKPITSTPAAAEGQTVHFE